MIKPDGFVHLHNHSTYSIGDSVSLIPDMVKRAAAIGQKALAITDHGTMAGVVEHMKECKKAGIKPIIGMEAYVAYKSAREPASHENPTCHMVLLARNLEGYRNLCKLLQWGYTDGFYTRPRFDLDVLSKHSKGLIASTACLNGLPQRTLLGWDTWDRKKKVYVNQPGRPDAVEGVVGTLKDIFEKDCLFLEVMYHRIATGCALLDSLDSDQKVDYEEMVGKQKLVTECFVELAGKMGMEFNIIATNDCHYPAPDRAMARQAAVAIGTRTYMRNRFDGKLASPIAPERNDDHGKEEDRENTSQMYVKSAEEMCEAMSIQENPGFEVFLENTVYLADMIETIDLAPKKNEKGLTIWNIPSLEADHPGETDDECMARLAKAGLDQRYPQGTAIREKAEKQMEYELQVMKDQGLAGYHLMTMDTIQWAKSKDIPVGPGRGSAAGSIVVYCLGITDLDPLRHDLLFERYLNPERISAADIDTDFDPMRVEEVVHYCIQKYGRDRVAKIATYGSIHAKGSVRNVGRVMGLHQDWVNEMAEALPTDQGEYRTKLEDVMKDPNSQAAKVIERFLREAGDRGRQMMELCVKLDDVKVSRGQHAAGIVISKTPLLDVVPLVLQDRENPDSITTEVPFDLLESVGLLKQDLLSINGLTIIDRCIKSIHSRSDEHFELPHEWDEKYNDVATYKLFARGDLAGVWQMSGQGMRELCMQLRPTTLKDIAALCALYRPGPLDYVDPATGLNMAEMYVRRKNNLLPVAYDHPSMKLALEGTYGVIVFQEQIMQLTRDLCGWTLAKADHLRKAVGKKDKDAIAKQKGLFIPDAVKHTGMSQELATKIWDQIETFGRYGFNIAHATGYAKISYQMGWLKAHYPVEFMAACISLVPEEGEKLHKMCLLHDYVGECVRLGLRVLPPDLMKSKALTVPEGNAGIRLGFSAIRDVASNADVIEKAVAAIADGSARLTLEIKNKKGVILEQKSKEVDPSKLYDVIRYLVQSGVNKKILQALINAGAFSHYATRPSVAKVVERITELRGKKSKVRMLEYFALSDEKVEDIAEDPASSRQCIEDCLYLSLPVVSPPQRKAIQIDIESKDLGKLRSILGGKEGPGISMLVRVKGPTYAYFFTLGSFQPDAVMQVVNEVPNEVTGLL